MISARFSTERVGEGQERVMRPVDESIMVPEGVSPGIDVLGAYHLLCPIATGGMASVWLAVDARSGRTVVVKRMLEEVARDLELRRAFADEAALGLRLRHPNLIETIEFGEASTPLGVERYLILELLRGRSLIDLMERAAARGVPVPIGVAMSVVRDAARGLHHLHQLTDSDGQALGIVHRDVSPQNLFVCLSGAAKVLDFGIAKANQQSHRTETGEIKGKLAYLAPEQIRGHVPDARLDVFALGVVMYELLTGQRLFLGGNDAETLYRVLEHPVPPPERVRTGVPAGLGAIALRALHRDRERRLPSAAALADAIEAVAEHEGIELDPETTRVYLTLLFPDEEQKHAERTESAQRLYAHLGSGALSVGEPTPAPSAPAARPPHRTRRQRPLLRAALTLCALSLSAFAAASVARLLRHQIEPSPVTPMQEQVQEPVTPRVSAPLPELPDPTTLEHTPATTVASGPRSRDGRGGSRVPNGCAVYYSITKGKPTVVCAPQPARAPGTRKSRHD